MATSRTPVSKKTTTKKTVSDTTLPASTVKSPPKSRAKTAATASTPKTVRPKQEKLTLDAPAPAKTRVTKKTTEMKSVTPEERYQMIAAAAYFLAERHGFTSGRALDDWIAAEKEIDGMLKS